MPAPNVQVDLKEAPVSMVGGTHFGRYPKISNEATWNFIVSDSFLVPYAGYKNVLTLDVGLLGRGIYSSYVGNLMIAVIGLSVYKITVSLLDGSLISSLVGTLFTSIGDVYIAENNNAQICITDGLYVYVYNWSTGVFDNSNSGAGGVISFPFSNPGYVSFQNGRLIIASTNTTNWVLSGFNDAESWSATAPFVGSIQTKPDFCQAAVPLPGGGNNLLVFGRNVTELWQDVGAATFPYQRNSTRNFDYGCLNPATVAHLDTLTVWLGVNEQSGPVLMAAYGTDVQQISTDGIDYKLGNLTDPENCTGFLYQQDGHRIYQFTFPTDNISYAYDFETKLFFNVSDENLNYHIAREIVYFNNTYYFVSLNGGNIYAFDTIYTAAQYSDTDIKQLPRIRITPPMRLPSQRYYICKSLGFTIENGQPNSLYNYSTETNDNIALSTESNAMILTENGNIIDTEASAYSFELTQESEQVNLAISRDGGETYGNFVGQYMNQTGNFKSRFIFQRLGIANDITFQIRFNGYGRFVVTEGIAEIYQ